MSESSSEVVIHSKRHNLNYNEQSLSSPEFKISRHLIDQLLEGSLFPQTTSTYRCANETCQTEKEKQIEKRMSLIKEKEDALAVREEKKQQAKMEMKKAAGFME